MEITTHIVRFDEWCPKCKYQHLDDKYDPCNKCLDEPVNTNSKQPVLYEEKERV